MARVGVHTIVKVSGETEKVEHKSRTGIDMVENDLMRDKNNLVVVYQEYPHRYTEPQYKKAKNIDRLKQLLKRASTSKHARKLIVGALESGVAV